MSNTIQELTTKLLALNLPENPFWVAAENGTVTATWNLVDAKWLQIFAKAGRKETYQLVVKLNEATHEASYEEKTGTITWEAGVPKVSFSSQYFRGKQISIKKGVAFGVKTDLSAGKLYEFDFDTKKIKDPIIKIIEAAGWMIKRSFLEKLMGM